FLSLACAILCFRRHSHSERPAKRKLRYPHPRHRLYWCCMSMARSAEPFRLGLGHPALEFVATLAGRQREPIERLASADDLGRWLTVTGLAPDSGCTSRHLAQAHRLREAIYRLLDAARTAQPPASRDVAVVNAWARRSRPAPQLDVTLRLVRQACDPCAV